MKTIKELKEIANVNSELKSLNSLEKAIVLYFNGEDSFLKEELAILESSEVLSIIQSISKLESITASLNIDSLDYSFDHNELNSLLKNVKIDILLNKEDFNVLLSKNISQLNVELVLEKNILGFKTIKKESSLDLLTSKMAAISKKSSPRLVNMRNNVVMVSMMMLGTAMFSSCGSGGIGAKVDYKVKPPTMITMPSIEEQIEGDFELNFANHAVYQNEEDELTSYQMSEAMLLTVPKTIQQTNFQSSQNKPTLTLTANGQYVCSYIWVGVGQSNENVLDGSVSTSGEYRMHKSCFQEMEVANGMVMKIENLPKAKTITMKFHFEK
jgi:hypothetical protein